MKASATGRKKHDAASYPPKLVPTGSFDQVLLIGGKNLTLFQSVALVITALAVAFGVGVPIILHELYLKSQLGRYGYSRSLSSMLVATAFILWAAVMLINGLLGIARHILTKHQN
jgi:hypothetical protein